MLSIKRFKKPYPHVTVELAALNLPDKCILNGANGCGKSTLFKAAAGVIRFQGNIQAPRRVLYVPVQMPLPRQTIGAFLPLLKGPALALFHDFFTPDQYALSVRECSTGMTQKLRLIYALSWPAECYCLDEPLHGLDPASAAWAMRVLRAIKPPVSVITHTPAGYPGWPLIAWP